MSPAQLKASYLNISVRVPIQTNPRLPVSDITTLKAKIRSYRNADMNSSANEKSSLIQFMRQNHYSSADRTAAARAFNGKASVYQCQRALVAIWQSGFAGVNLQRYCDTYFGLDCSGFVNNYFLREHALREMSIPSYFRRGEGRIRTNFTDFRAKDVLIWCNGNGVLNSTVGRHIAIIDSIQGHAGNELRANVVESTGTLGLVESLYTFIETSTSGVYRVNRPLKPTTRNHVRVVPVI